jgi:autotransporter-associated beta strand protein
MTSRQGLAIQRAAVLQTAVACIVAHATVVVADNLVAPTGRPNIIVINTDDVGYNEFGYTAALNQRTTQFETPRIDALAAQSSVITNGYVTNALCSPSRAGLLTGLYPQRFGFEDNISRGVNGEVDGLPAGQITIASQLKSLGYSTAAMGKWHVGPKDDVNRPQDVGFDEFYGFLGGGRSFFRYGSGSTFDRNMLRGDASIEATWASEGDPSLYDPVRGRYLTDALGEEAASYVTQHANSNNPFFLYVALNATHTPHEVKQQDYDQFAHITNDSQRTLAAMSYAMDRAVGMILDSIQSNGLADNTVIVFTSDNGGASPHHSNAPYLGSKGSLFEGGIRVPFLVRAPGVEAGVYDRPISTLDLLPTFVSLAGGDASKLTTDGVDILPYLSGESSGDPHEALFWRSHDGRFAVRRGDWKLVSPGGINPFARLHDLATDPGERRYSNSQHPEIVAELVRNLTLWEAELHKAEWGSLGLRNKNNFDHFVYLPEQGADGVWSTSERWREAGTTTAVSLTPEDAYANAVLEFRTNNDGSYTATNDMLRVTRQTFMLNQLRFAGIFAGAENAQATVNGNALLMVKNLYGQLPRLQVDAKQSQAPDFTFQLDNELQLLDDLEIAGHGTQSLIINGSIRDYYAPRGVHKTGRSRVTLAGNNTFGGNLTVDEGRLILDGPAAAIRDAAAIVIGSEGQFDLVSGTVLVPAIVNNEGGKFNVRGGVLQTGGVIGNLLNDGGIFSPGPSIVQSEITGAFTQRAGSLEIEIGGPPTSNQFDTLTVHGAAVLDGTLNVKLLNGAKPAFGQVFPIISAAGGITGDFDQVLQPGMGLGLYLSALTSHDSLSLVVRLSGDYNNDGSVDGADYVVWKTSDGRNVPPGTGADGNRDGRVNNFDFRIWKRFYNPVSENPSLLGDYNADDHVNAGDYVVWRSAYGEAVNVGTGADGNRDGWISEPDFDLWKANFGRLTTIDIPGDFNRDGRVDSADYVVWRRSSGQSVALGTGADGNHDGRIDDLDFALWKSNFGYGPNAGIGPGLGISAVPEPGAAIFIPLTAFFVTLARFRSKVLPTRSSAEVALNRPRPPLRRVSATFCRGGAE